MLREMTSIQLEKVRMVKNYLNKSIDSDSLYHVVVLLGPSFIGSLIGSNSATVWSRIENPQKFRYAEMEIFSQVFEISIEKLLVVIKKLIEHNQEEVENNRPIGRKRYNNVKCNARVKGKAQGKKRKSKR